MRDVKVIFNIGAKARDELRAMSRENSRSMTEIIRVGVGLARVAFEAQRAGNKLVVVSPAGEAIKEIVLP